MKKHLSLLLALILILSLTACGQNSSNDGGEKPEYKIGVVTGTVSQGEEEFRAAERLVEEYGDKIVHVTYPDKFDQEQETTISQISALAADPDVKAIVMVQAVNGITAAMEAVHEMRDDILFVLGAPHEDVNVVSERADMILELGQMQRGDEIAKKAKEMGAETFIHYSFPRHMSYELLSARRDHLKATSEELGMKFIEVDAPDPTSDAGVPGSQQFILEDVPRQISQHGKDTAFFSTNCAMMDPLIKQTLDLGGIFPEQCCPSPYHAYPSALGIEIPEDKAGDLDYLNEQISAKIAEKGGTGRFGTWVKPANAAMIDAGVQYAIEYAEGNIERFDKDAMTEIMKKVTEDENDEVLIESIDEDHENFLVFILGAQIY